MRVKASENKILKWIWTESISGYILFPDEVDCIAWISDIQKLVLVTSEYFEVENS